MKIDTVGSFLPPEILQTAISSTDINPDHIARLRDITDESVRRLIDDQIRAGLSCVTSGELRRRYWDKDFYFGLGGITREYVDGGRIYQDTVTFTDVVRCTGPVAFNPGHPFFDDFRFLNDYTAGRAECRQTMPSPAELYLTLRSTLATNGPYTSADRLADDIATAYRDTIMHLYSLGCRHVQFDDTVCGRMCDSTFTKRLIQGGVDMIALQNTIIELLNSSISHLPADMAISVYLSGGPRVVPEWDPTPRPDNIIPEVLKRVGAHRFFIPLEDSRAEAISILRYIPDGKNVVLGVVPAHTPFPIDADTILTTVSEASKYVRPEHLAISPSSGFKLSTFASRGLLYADQWHKIASLMEIAATL